MCLRSIFGALVKVDNTILADVSPKAKAINQGMNIVKENNCQGCHIINNYGG